MTPRQENYRGFSMLKKTLCTLLCILLQYSLLTGNVITGIVTSSDNNPIPYSIVFHKSSGDWDLSDENGFFHLSGNLSPGDTLTISRFGYETREAIITRDSRYQFLLNSEPITIEPIIIMGQKSKFNFNEKTIINKPIDSHSRTSIFQRIPGLTFNSSGGLAGNTSFSLDGGNSSHTKLTLKGVDLTSSQNGGTDVSQLPIQVLDQVTIAKSPGVFWGSGAMDGVLNINPWIDQTFIEITSGSYGYSSATANFHGKIKNWTYTFQTGGTVDEGNYPYSWEDISAIRENNRFQQLFSSIFLKGMLSKRSFISAYQMNSWNDRGVAGDLVWGLTPKAYKSDDLFVSSLNYGHLLKNGFIKFHYNRRGSHEKFVDPNSIWATNSKHSLVSNTFKSRWENRFNELIFMQSLLEVKQENISGTDAGKHSRTSAGFAMRFQVAPVKWLRIIPSGRFDYIHKFYKEDTYDFNTIIFLNDELELSYSAGTGFRYPTFNDLYWDDPWMRCNPELNSERTQYQTAKIQSVFDQGYILFRVKVQSSHDLISWAPVDPENLWGEWKVYNINKSNRISFNVNGKHKLFPLPLTVQYHGTKLITEDESTGEPLAYTPDFTGMLGLFVDIFNINSGLQFFYTGERKDPYGNSLEDFLSVNGSADWEFDIFNHIVSVKLLVENLLDENTMTNYGYPEPGRILKIGLRYDFR